MQFHFLTTLKRKRLSYLILFTLEAKKRESIKYFHTLCCCFSDICMSEKMGLTSQSPTEFLGLLGDAFSRP